MMLRKSALNLTLAAAAVALGLYLSRGPWRVYNQQKLKADAATREMQKSEQSKASLLKQEAQIESPLGQEELARKHLYLDPREHPITQEHPIDNSDSGQPDH